MADGFDPIAAVQRALLLDLLAQRDLLTRIAALVRETDVADYFQPRRRTRASALLAIQALAQANVAQRGAEIDAAARLAGVDLLTLRDSEHRVWHLMAHDPAYGADPTWAHPWG